MTPHTERILHLILTDQQWADVMEATRFTAVEHPDEAIARRVELLRRRLEDAWAHAERELVLGDGDGGKKERRG